MLYLTPDAFQATRIQGIQFSPKDISHIINDAKNTHGNFKIPE